MIIESRFNIGDTVLYLAGTSGNYLEKGTVTGFYYSQDREKGKMIYKVATSRGEMEYLEEDLSADLEIFRLKQADRTETIIEDYLNRIKKEQSHGN